MKRVNNIYAKICDPENLRLADQLARKGKLKTRGVNTHDRNRDGNIATLRQTLEACDYKTSEYSIFTIHEKKERIVYRLPYFPDRIMHHAIMNALKPIIVPMFTSDTYSCIEGRGVHLAAKKLRRALRDRQGTHYCLKLDIVKFYPSVNHEILKGLLRRKIKDTKALTLLDEIIESAAGLPIGNYTSQYFANLYMTGFDHWIKEQAGVKYYFRYADDIVILSDNKADLHQLLSDIRGYLHTNLKLSVKGNYQVFPVSSRSIDFLGYRFYHTHTLLRKSIKQDFARMIKSRFNPASLASYRGWSKHADSKHLLKKLLHQNKINENEHYNHTHTFTGNHCSVAKPDGQLAKAG